MLTKTESTALLRYLARGLKNNTISKAHGRQLMDLAGKIRADYRKVPKGMSSFTERFIKDVQKDHKNWFDLLEEGSQQFNFQNMLKPKNTKQVLKQIYANRAYNQYIKNGYSQDTAYNIYQNVKRGIDTFGQHLNPDFYRELSFITQDLKKPQVAAFINNLRHNQRPVQPFLSMARTKATPIQQLLKNPKNRALSQGKFNTLKIDPTRYGYRATSAQTYGTSAIDSSSMPRGYYQYISPDPTVPKIYNKRDPNNIIIQYDTRKLRDDVGLPLLPKTDQYVLTKRWDRIKNPDPFDQLKTKGPYYQMVAVNQPDYMPWNAIEKIYHPFISQNGTRKFLRLDNWRDAFRPSKTLDMYTQLYS